MDTRVPSRLSPAAALAAVVAFVATLATGALPAAARDSYVQDGASLFKSSTVSTLNSSIGDLTRATGKEIVVVTVPSLNGKDAKTAVEDAFSQQQVNGVLFFFAKEEKKDYVVGDRASRSFFPQGSFTDVTSAMRGDLRSGDPDTAVITGVNLVIDQYRGHVSNGARRSGYGYGAPVQQHTSQGGFGMGIIWLLIILVAGWLIIRAIFRAVSGPRMMPPGYGGPGYGGPGYGGPGYGGGGFGGGGGGGSFFSGLLGGLGGAFLGNELFGRRDNFGDGGMNAGFGDNGGSVDNSGFQSDAGQADMGGMGGGDWGGGGDSGGGGGDSGGGW